MLNYSIMRLEEDHIDEICADVERQVKSNICTMPLFIMTLTPEGDPAIDKADMLCRVYEKYRERLDAKSLPSGALIQASIGHGWKLDAPSAFQKYVGLNDGKSPEVCCPMDKGFQKYIRNSAARIASAAPHHIMLDDDFRLMFRHQRGCACPLHMAEFNRIAGTDISREEMYRVMCEGGEQGQKYKEIFVKTQIDSLIECAKEIRAGIDSVDPSIPGSYCLCGDSSEGAYEIATIMAGKGNPITLRVNNANYCARDPRFFAHVMHRASIQISALSGKPDVLLAETDTCPQNRYSSSAAMLHSHFTFSILEGAKGAKHWITRPYPEVRSGNAYRKKLEKYSGFYHELSAINDSLTWLGCKIPVSPKPFYVLTPSDTSSAGDGWYGRVLDRFGLPMHFSNSGEGVCFFDSGRDKYFSDDEIIKFLSGKVILDATAAERFIVRGFGKYIGVNVLRREISAPNASGEIFYPTGESRAQYDIRELIPLSDEVTRYSDVYHLRDGICKDIMFPGVTSYKNELGGTVVVFAGSACFDFNLVDAFGFINESRKNQLVQIMTDLGELPVYCPEDSEVLMKAARMSDGRMLCALLEMGLDTIDGLELVIRRDVKEIKRLNCKGEYEKVAFERDGELFRLDVTVDPFDPLILIVE